MSEVPGQAPASYGLSDYAAMLRRRWGWVVFGLLLGLGAGYVVSDQLRPAYVSEASVLVEPMGVLTTSLANGRTSGEINLDTEAQLVKSAEVATRAQEAIGSRLPLTELVDQVSVTVPPNSQVLTIAFEAETPQAAQEGAQAFSQAYLDSRSEIAKADVDARSEEVQAQITTASTSLQEVVEQLAGLDADSPELATVESQRSLFTQRIVILNEQLQDLAALDDRPGRIINPAIVPEAPSGPGKALIYGSALMLGLLIGVGLLLMRERTDRRLLSLEDATGDTGLRIIGRVPPTTVWGADATVERTAYERLRNVVVSTAGRHRVLLVTGADHGVPVATVASNLAERLAATGRRVVLVDAPSAGVATEPSDEPGLSDVLASGDWTLAGLVAWDGSSSAVLQADYVRIGPGTRPDLLHHLLASPVASSTFNDLRRLVDLVLVVAPHDDVASSQTIATLADGVIHVAVRRRSRRPDLVASVQRTTQVGAPSVGLVVVDYPPRPIATFRSLKYRFQHRHGDQVAAAEVAPTDATEETAAANADQADLDDTSTELVPLGRLMDGRDDDHDADAVPGTDEEPVSSYADTADESSPYSDDAASDMRGRHEASGVRHGY